ncbi:MAG: penicillin-binding protein 2 [Verrucomicrobia bacterium]|nr:MAG: penicillin-binding protein 2 [Verrucomicrobiota bacterium]
MIVQREETASHRQILILSSIAIAVFAILILRLSYLQVIRGNQYKAKIKGNSELTVRIPAVRGEIFDRNGIPLVENRASLQVDLYLPDIVKAYKENEGTVPVITYRAFDHGMPINKEEADIVQIVQTSVIPRLEKLGLAGDYNTRKLQLQYRNNKEVPFSYRKDLDFETMARFCENSLNLPGVNVTLTPVRNYVYGALAAHLFGYVGWPTEIDPKEASQFNFYEPDVVGKAQIELAYDTVLRGTPGQRILQRNAHGGIEKEEEQIKPKQGANVYLTIDARIQYIAEQALRVVGRGAIVVLNPNNGDVLAMASVPSFDPNKFVPTISKKDWESLVHDETDPLTNRALSSYAPGSIFKLCTSLAGIRAGIGDREFTCTGGVQYGDKFMKCWVLTAKPPLPPHGKLHLSDAIKKSCNAFFYQYGNAAGIDQIDSVGKMLGLGQKTGLPLNNEAPGVLPGPEWLAANAPQERWSAGYTANVAIGQGFVLTTPIQMGLVGSTVANGGIYYQPRLVKKVVAQDGMILSEEPTKIRSDLKKEGGFTDNQIQQVRLGMWKVVNEDGGTARKARLEKNIVAGKTGTAQFWRGRSKDNHTWFIGFAPYEHPKYVVIVLVQGAKSGGAVAAPLASKVLQEIFAMEAGKEVKLTPLKPAVGNFKHISSIDFSNATPCSYGPDIEPGDSPVDASPRSGSSSRENMPTPDISEDADARGHVKNKQQNQGGLQKFFNFLGGGRSAAPKN